MEDDKLLLC